MTGSDGVVEAAYWPPNTRTGYSERGSVNGLVTVMQSHDILMSRVTLKKKKRN